MAKTKIDYGIDLGTTNSAIARIDSGRIRIIKSDRYQKDTTPSCVYFTRQKILVGDDAILKYQEHSANVLRNYKGTYLKKMSPNGFTEFKRAMGTDTQHFSENTKLTYSPEVLSAEVLKKLKSYNQDEDIDVAVITVPAKFRQNQIDATQRAAELAGFSYCELLMEPIAASLAYGIDTKKIVGYWLVFDFGGGTFDAALMRVDQGIMKVVDTEGDNRLGGRDIDYAIVDHILIPHIKDHYPIDKILSDQKSKALLRDVLKFYAEVPKIDLSNKNTSDLFVDKSIMPDDEGNEIELEISEIRLKDFEKTVEPIFQRSIDISLNLLKRNNITGADLETLILVGGPTFSQTLRKMLKEQLTPNIDTQIDPMTAVARGAALFASTRDIPLDIQKRDKSKIQLVLKYPETSVETEENLGIRIAREQTTAEIPQQIFIEITRDDKGWASGRIEIKDDAEFIPLLLNTGKPNGFIINLFDAKGSMWPCEPSVFTIIQGLKAAKATLPYSLCIVAFDTQKGKTLLQELPGLKKNQTLPAKGKGIFKTQKDIRPGKNEDEILIPIYEGDPGTRALYNEFAQTTVIRGEDISQFLPANSDVEITLHVDGSRRITVTADFPYIDETIEISLEKNIQSTPPAHVLEGQIEEALSIIATLKEVSFEEQSKKLSDELSHLSDLLETGREDHDTRLKIIERLRDVMKTLEKMQEESEWPKVEQELKTILEKLVLSNQRYGNEKATQLVNQYNKDVQIVIKQKDENLAGDLIKEIRAFNFALISQDTGYWIGNIKYYDDNFDDINWTDRRAAKQLITSAKKTIATSPSKQTLQEIVWKLWDLLPEETKSSLGKIDERLLRKE